MRKAGQEDTTGRKCSSASNSDSKKVVIQTRHR
jgi:hypothetical protein